MTNRTLARTRVVAGALAALALMPLLLPGWAEACSTPVYRYALYHWAPSPYRVFYVHRGGVAPEDEAVNKKITDLLDAGPALANVVLEVIDLDKQALEKLPEPLQKVKDLPLPQHLVFTPWGAEIFSGKLDEGAVDAMVESPVRAQVAKMLDGGQVAALVLLLGVDPAENERAEKVASELIAKAAAGNLLGEGGAETESSDPNEPAAPKLELGLIKLGRTDPAETWLIRALTAVESDLNEKPLADKPMLFGVYGQGRALPPFVGEGITSDNLIELVLFLTGACSCQVKDANPGMDLLIRWDWESTAQKIAENDETLNPVVPDYAEFPVAASESAAMSEAAEGEKSKPAEKGASSPTAKDTPTAPTEPSPPAEATGPSAKESDPSVAPGSAGSAAAVATKTVLKAEAQTSSSRRTLSRLGIALGIGAAVVLLFGLVLVRKRSA